MDGFRDRFEGFSPEERVGLVSELESQVTVRGKRLLTTPELEELIQILPSGHFRLSLKAGLRELRTRREAFPDKIADFTSAVERLVETSKAILSAKDAAAREQLLEDFAALRLFHPALWFRVYAKLKAESLGWAMELQPRDRMRPFKKP